MIIASSNIQVISQVDVLAIGHGEKMAGHMTNLISQTAVINRKASYKCNLYTNKRWINLESTNSQASSINRDISTSQYVCQQGGGEYSRKSCAHCHDNGESHIPFCYVCHLTNQNIQHTYDFEHPKFEYIISGRLTANISNPFISKTGVFSKNSIVYGKPRQETHHIGRCSTWATR